jgi:bleomycin hydrolase
MKLKLSIVLAGYILSSVASLSAQEGQPYTFKPYKTVASTAVKDQQQTGTCWAFSAASLLESEAMRISKKSVDLSEMFVVRHIYRKKCENYVRRQGTAQFGQGGLAHDYMNAVREFGVVPESVYPGRKSASEVFNHEDFEKRLKKTCDEMVAKGKKGELDPNWLTQIDAILDEQFGKLPGKFTEEGRPYSATLYRDFLGIQPADYVTITSFTHHPFWAPCVLEVPDNFSNGMMYNVPLDDLMRSMNYALQNGYSIDWDADVSNQGFSAQNGLAILPLKEWSVKTEAERGNTFRIYEKQRQVTQEYRQEMFDRQVTTDDHLMHIVGIETEAATADIYYTVKNSWGEISDLKGYLRVSEPYLRLNTISFMVHKSALPLDVKQRLGFVNTEAAVIQPEPKKKPASTDDIRPEAPVQAPLKNKSGISKTRPVESRKAPRSAGEN